MSMSSLNTESIDSPMARPILIPSDMTGETYGVKMSRLLETTSRSWRAAEYTSRQAGRDRLVFLWGVRDFPVSEHDTNTGQFLKGMKMTVSCIIRDNYGRPASTCLCMYL